MGKYRITRFKRAYIEITSSCNLHCSFCQETLRPPHFMSYEEFRHVIQKIKPYTGFIYLHVKGEPLLHPELEKILLLCRQEDIQVNITTNGTLLLKRLPILLKYPVHQINISLHSADDNDCINMDTYYIDVFKACQELLDNTDTEISLRLWTTTNAQGLFGKKNLTVKPHLYINVQSPFQWPDPDNDYYEPRGFCMGLRTHIAVLCDGTVVPCCLDGNSNISLGNIFISPMEDILNSQRAVDFYNGFNSHMAVEELCRHCSFKERFDKNWKR